MQYIRARALQKKFLEKKPISIDNILDSWVIGDVTTERVGNAADRKSSKRKEIIAETNDETKDQKRE